MKHRSANASALRRAEFHQRIVPNKRKEAHMDDIMDDPFWDDAEEFEKEQVFRDREHELFGDDDETAEAYEAWLNERVRHG
jgi:hypothetical protein